MTFASRGRVRRVWAIVISLSGLMSMLACGGGNTTPLQLPIAITLLTATTTLNIGQSIMINANVYDQNNRGATWTLLPVDFGTLSNQTPTSVTYTPPNNFSVVTTVTITATSISNPAISSSVQFSVSPVTVALFPPVAQTMNQGEQLFISPSVVGDPTNSGLVWALSPSTGSLDTSQPFQVTYTAPTTVSSPTTVTVTATSVANPNAAASLKITIFPAGAGLNVAAVNVDGGPVPGQTHANGAFTTVTVCNPGSTSACQTIDGVLVDTGSYGLRILQSQIPLLKLPGLVDGNQDVLENCDSAPDGSYLWGPVATADVYIAGEIASSVPIQVISSSNSAVPDGCSNGGTTNKNTPQLLGANGILGVGPEPTDCTVAGVNYCDGSSAGLMPPNLYYECPSNGCATTDLSIVVPANQQVTNPVVLFNDRNGLIIKLPAVTGTQASLLGTLTFGIGGESNNQLGAETVLTLDSKGNFTTAVHGQTLTKSFIDSGSNALFFPDTLPACAESIQFFCPTALTNFSATNQGATQGQTTVDFSVENADSLFSAHTGDAVFSTLAGPEGAFNTCTAGSGSCAFVWGLPFFYGRSVFVAIDQQSPPPGTPVAPWWAY